MPVTPLELLESAEKLSGEKNETCWRLASIQAYYSTYHECICVADQLAIPEPRNQARGAHQQLINRFSNPTTDNALKAIGALLGMARVSRRKASYDIELDFTESEAMEQLALVKKIKTKLHELNKPSGSAAQEQGKSS